ncbi:hypothetical protein PRIPAC_73746 [Pristionchus pacificus]|uniref:Endo/exonuclease/phosphatase domain-containing protein n=1 Tax=Pristionchus pacificus TaxID=54126 RepID=A0A2A6CT70_PRIPA|nr:hypothetical protein PRIPAC_73746 [Pristionchus pacificus]|eukprot:PDM81257.1 hypothetical protein PRIPAC_36260 [Pristionchus pacificus]
MPPKAPISPSDAAAAKIIKLLESLHEKLDARPVCECNQLRQEMLEIRKMMGKKPVEQPPPPPMDSYAAVKLALNDASMYADKAKRAVWVGRPEESTPELTTASDQKAIEQLCAELNDGHIASSHRGKDPPPPPPSSQRKRILKIAFTDEKTSDHFLSLIRSNRPSTVTRTPGNFVRRDLCHYELQLKRKARMDAFTMNCKIGGLAYGVRDEKLIKFNGIPRPLPDGYESRPPRGYSDSSILNHTNPVINTSILIESNASLNESNVNSSSNILSSLSPMQSKPKENSSAKGSGYHVILLSETWLTSDDADAFLMGSLGDYVAFRKDRITNAEITRGGGVAILCSPLLNPILLATFSSDGIECLVIDIHFPSNRKTLSSIRICLIYRSPSCPASSITLLLSFIEPLISNLPFLICGDLNFPSIDWSRLTSPSQNDFLSFVCDHRLTQFVDFKTRGENLLDLVLCNENIVRNVTPSLPFADHTSISFSLGVPPPPSSEFVPSRQYHLADWESINKSFVPKSSRSPFSHYPKHLRILYGKSQRASSFALNSIRAVSLAKRFERALRVHSERVESRVIDSKNPKAFYSLCKTRLNSSKSAPPGIIELNGAHLLTNKDKALAFSQYFASVSTLPLQAPLRSFSPSSTIPLFDLPSISPAQILASIASLAPKCNFSPDGRNLRRSHPLRIGLPYALPKSHSSFATRIIDRWNVLPADFVNSSPIFFRSYLLSLPSISFTSDSLLRL